VLVGAVLVFAGEVDARARLVQAARVAEDAAASLADAGGGAAASSRSEPADGASANPAGAEAEPALADPPATLDVDLETPFDEAPVVAPGEDVPVRIRVDAPGLDEAPRLRLAVREGDSRRVRSLNLDGSTVVRSVSFETAGRVAVAATADHPRAEADTARASGRCQPYREAVGDLLEDLREDARRHRFGAGEGATPRQLCRAVPSGPTDALRDRLEEVLYGDDPVSRADYLDVAELADRVAAESMGEAP
jgi:hypothetical protein